MRARITHICIILSIILVWEVISELKLVNPIILGPFSKTLVSLWEDLSSGIIFRHLKVTLMEFGIAYAIAASFGLFIGLFLGTIKTLQDIYEPILTSLYAVPIIILYPIILIILGFGMASKIAFASCIGFFPIALNTIAGVKSVDNQLIMAGRTMGAGKLSIFFKVIIPGALPIILTALRLGMNSTMIGVIAGEIIASMAGMGYLISEATTTLDIPRLYGSILIILTVIVALNQGASRLEKLVEAQK